MILKALSFLCFLCACLGWLSMLDSSHFFQFFYVFSGLLLFFFTLFFLKKRPKNFLFLLAVLLLFSFISSIRSDFSSVFMVLSILTSFSIIWFCYESGFGDFIFVWPFIFFLLFLVYLIVFASYGTLEFNTLIDGRSRNGVSAILLASSIGYIWWCKVNEVSISCFLILVCLFVSIPLYSRSGLASFFVLLLIVFFQKYKVVTTIVVLIFLAYFGVCNSDFLQLFLQKNTNFNLGLESPRFQMIKDYLSSLDWQSFIFGLDVSTVPIIAEYGNNPHNGFIRMHSFFGILAFLIIFYLLFQVVRRIFSLDFFMGSLMVIVLFRASMDIIYLGNVFDFMVLGPFLFPSPRKSNCV